MHIRLALLAQHILIASFIQHLHEAVIHASPLPYLQPITRGNELLSVSGSGHFSPSKAESK